MVSAGAEGEGRGLNAVWRVTACFYGVGLKQGGLVGAWGSGQVRGECTHPAGVVGAGVVGAGGEGGHDEVLDGFLRFRGASSTVSASSREEICHRYRSSGSAGWVRGGEGGRGLKAAWRDGFLCWFSGVGITQGRNGSGRMVMQARQICVVPCEGGKSGRQ